MKAELKKEYLLGVNEQELERLRFQHHVWKPVTDNFFTRLGVREGWNCLDTGGGPGFVAMDLRERVGTTGSVTMLEPSPYYTAWFRNKVESFGWNNVTTVESSAETADLPEQFFDIIFVRWVLSFIANPEQFILNLKKSLKPGGILAVQDYYYEGISLYPHGSFQSVGNIMRGYYQSNGGDPFIAGKLRSIFRKNGFKLAEFLPHSFAGGPNDEITEWAGQFFTMHLPIMAEKGVLTREESNALLDDWNEHRRNPDMVFFSPIVVDVAGVLEK